MSKREVARRFSMKASGSTLWMSSLGDDFDMPNELFRIAMLFHLDLPVFRNNPARGADGKRLKYDANFADHALTCTSMGGYVIARHNAIAKSLAYFCRQAGALVSIEQRVTFTDQTRVDVTAIFADLTIDLDVSVAHVTASSHLSSAQSAGGVAKKRAKEKMKKHGHINANRYHEFRPFVLESHGRFGTHAIKTVKELAQRIVERDGLPGCRKTYAAIMFEIRRRLSLTLQKSNAAIIAEAMKRSIQKSKGSYSLSSVLPDSDYVADESLMS